MENGRVSKKKGRKGYRNDNERDVEKKEVGEDIEKESGKKRNGE